MMRRLTYPRSAKTYVPKFVKRANFVLSTKADNFQTATPLHLRFIQISCSSSNSD